MTERMLDDNILLAWAIGSGELRAQGGDLLEQVGAAMLLDSCRTIAFNTATTARPIFDKVAELLELEGTPEDFDAKVSSTTVEELIDNLQTLVRVGLLTVDGLVAPPGLDL